MRRIHLCLDISGALKNPKVLKMLRGNLIDDKGKPVYEVKEIKRLLQHELDLGHNVIPAHSCDNFDYQKSCLGHDVEEEQE